MALIHPLVDIAFFLGGYLTGLAVCRRGAR